MMDSNAGDTRITIAGHSDKPHKQRRVAGAAEEEAEADPLESDDTAEVRTMSNMNVF